MRYLCLSIFTILCFSIQIKAADLNLHFLVMDNFLPPGEYSPSFTANNSESDAVTSFTIEWSVNGGDMQTYSFTNIAIPTSNTLLQFDIPQTFDIVAGESYDLHFQVTEINGATQTPSSSNQISHRVAGLTGIPDKQILIEKIAATWCGFCPEGTVIMNEFLNTYPGDALAAVIYRPNDLVMPYSNDVVSTFGISGQPMYMVDRYPFPSTQAGNGAIQNFSRSVLEVRANNRLGANSPLRIQSTTNFDNVSRMLTVDVDANFLADIEGTLTLNAYILEDGIVSTQTNYNSSLGSNPINNYVHDNVVRDMLGGVLGTEGVFPNSISDGQTISHQYNYSVPSNFDENNLYVIVTVQQNGTVLERTILNALRVGINETNEHSIETIVDNSCATPPIAPDISTDLNVLCQGDVATMSLNTIVPAGFYPQWQNNGVDIPGETSLQYSSSIAGNFSVYFTNGDSGSPCKSEDSNILNIITGDIPDFNITETNINGTTVSFVTEFLSGEETAVLTWSFGDGDSSFLNNPTHVYDAPGSYVLCVTAENDCGVSPGVCEIIEVGESRKLFAKVLLEGPYNSSTGEMETALSELIPTQNPYSQAPYNYTGGDFVDEIPNDVVDWVLVELRTGTPGTTVSQTNVSATRAAFLLKDGSIAELDGTPGLGFGRLAIGENYHIVVRHRNHLDIISRFPIVGGPVMNYDFTTNVNTVAGDLQQSELGNNKAGMISGDFNSDGIIQVTDFDSWKLNPAANQVYLPIDGNLDRIVQVTDFDIWKVVGAKFGNVEIRF